MSASVTTLGVFNLWIVSSGVFVYFPHSSTSWPGLSASLPWHGVFLKPSSRSCLPSGWPARVTGDGASSSAYRTQGGAHLTGFCLAGSNILNKTEVGAAESLRQISCFRKDVSSRSTEWGLPGGVHAAPRPAHIQTHLPQGILTLDDKALFVHMLLICNFENKIETSCILKYKMKCDALYTI